jgi:hypothetical protein
MCHTNKTIRWGAVTSDQQMETEVVHLHNAPANKMVE